jgi:death-on-curing protein
MKVTIYPTLAETLELHTRLIERFGGKDGVRDLGLLESALMRPRTGYYKSLSLEAAALFQSLTQNHAFLDGNKRVAFATTAIFLRMNGFRLKVDADTGEEFIINEVIKKRAGIEIIATWLEKYMKAV